MSRFISFPLSAVALALSATVASAQIYPLTNGPNGTGSNTVDSAKGFAGANAVASEREFLYHPDRAGNAAAELGITGPTDGTSVDAPAPPRARHRRRPAGSASMHGMRSGKAARQPS